MKTLLALLLVCFSLLAKAQTDTSFWFVAPDILASAGDSPVRFKITSQGQATQVKISMPANQAFVPIQFQIGANGFFMQDMTALLSAIENSPINTINNKGIKIEATTPVTVYYENVGNNCASCKNADIISLKGKNALGTSFFIPAQNVIPNTNGGRSGFDVVATQDSTTITFQLTRAATGFPAGQHSIILHAGQTFSIQAASTTADGHLSGSQVVANKPIAITLKDDQVAGGQYWGSNCRDLLTDQLIPVDFIGRSYILQNTGNMSGSRDLVVFTATENNTVITANGNTPIVTLQAGQTHVHEFTSARLFVSSNHPIYVVHITGFNCAAGMALIPPLECTGSYQVGISRTQNQDFSLNLITRSGHETGFTFTNNNGNSFSIPATNFQDVPGTAGSWKSASVSLTNSQLPNNGNVLIRNTSGLFHAGFINGNAAHGSKYGYFSDFSSYLIHAVLLNGGNNLLCEGASVTLDVDSIVFARYQWTGPNGFSSTLRSPTIQPFTANDTGFYYIRASVEGCESNLDSIYLGLRASIPALNQSNNGPLCLGDSLRLHVDSVAGATYLWTGPNAFQSTLRNPVIGAVSLSDSGIYQVVVSLNGCSSAVASTQVQISNFPAQPQISASGTVVCRGEAVVLRPTQVVSGFAYRWYLPNGSIISGDSLRISAFQAADTGMYRLVVSHGNCESVADSMVLQLAPDIVLANIQTTTNSLCNGDSAVLRYTPQPGQQYRWLLNDSVLLSNTDTFLLVTAPGAYRLHILNQAGCSDTTQAVQITAIGPANLTLSLSRPPVICAGDSFQISYPHITGQLYQWFRNGQALPAQTASIFVSAAGTYSLRVTDSLGCSLLLSDSIEVVVDSLPQVSILASDTLRVCFNRSFTLRATANPLATYQWYRNGLLLPGHTDSMLNAQTGGQYFVVAGYGSQCTDTSNVVTVVVDTVALPTVNVAADTTLCVGDSIWVSSTFHPSLQYRWVRNQTLLSTSDTALWLSLPGRYRLEVTHASGCIDTLADFRLLHDSIARPQLLAANHGVFCRGDSMSVHISNASQQFTYQWQVDGQIMAHQGNNLQLHHAAVVVVTAFNTTGCSATSDSLVLSFSPIDTPNIHLGASTTACEGDSILLTGRTASSNVQFQWLRNGVPIWGASDSVLWVQQSGNYQLRVTDSLGCSLTSQTLSLAFNPVATPPYQNALHINICEGDSTRLGVSLWTGNYQWYRNGQLLPQATDTSIWVSQAGLYSFTFRDTAGCTGYGDTINVQMLPKPQARIILSDSGLVCSGRSTSLFAQPAGGHSYVWLRNGLVIPHQGNSFLEVTDSGYYQVAVTNLQGCTDTSALVEIQILPPVMASISSAGGLQACEGDSIQLIGNAGGGQGQWLFNNQVIVGAIDSVYWAKWSGVYRFLVSNSLGCTDTSGVLSLSFQPKVQPPIQIIGTDTLCPGENKQLRSSGMLTYQWLLNGLPIAGANDSVLQTSMPGVYRVIGEGAMGCSDTSAALSLFQGIAPNPVLQLAGASTICPGGQTTIQLQLNNSTLLGWYRNDTLISGHFAHNLQVQQSGFYYVIAQSTTHCIDTSNRISIQISAAPAVSIQPANAPTFCAGDSLLLRANGPAGLVYQWMRNGNALTGATTDSLYAPLAGNYSVVVTDTNGCSFVFGPLTVSQFSPTPVTITAQGPTAFCEGDTLLLQASSGPSFRYQWFNNQTLLSNDTLSFLRVTQSGTYAVRVSNQNGCYSQSTALAVVVHPKPNSGIQPTGTQFICSSDSMTLVGPASMQSYQWLRNGLPIIGATSPVYNTNVAGSYRLMATNNFGCVDTSLATLIQIRPVPVVTISSLIPNTLCIGDTNFVFVQSASASGLQYRWMHNGTALPNAAGDTIAVFQGGVYYLIATDSFGCSEISNTLNIFFNPSPPAQLLTPGPYNLCSGSTLRLAVLQAPNCTYQWYKDNVLIPGAQLPSLDIDESGSYHCTLQFLNGCSNSTSNVDVTLVLRPTANILSDSVGICTGNQIRLEANSDTGISYEWTGPANFRSNARIVTILNAQLRHSGWYILQTQRNGCTSEADSVWVEVSAPVPPIQIQGRKRLCAGNDLVLEPTFIANARYIWYLPNGDSLLTRQLSKQNAMLEDSGIYILKVTNGQCAGEEIAVKVEVSDFNFYFPTAFTPNADGLNEHFKVVTNYIGPFELYIYDRWGQRIFTGKSPGQVWDGTIDGLPAKPGAYNYVLYYNGCRGGQEALSGTVFLLR